MICFILSSLSILGSIEGTSTIDFLPKTTLTQDIVQTVCAQTSSIIKRQPKGAENNNRSVLNQRTGLTTQSQRSIGFSPYKLFKMIGCAFLIRVYRRTRQCTIPALHRLKFMNHNIQQPPLFFNRCINRVCQRYACPSELPPGMIPIAEESCAHNICITNKRGVYGKKPLKSNALLIALRDERIGAGAAHAENMAVFSHPH